MRCLAFWTLPSAWMDWMTWFLIRADSDWEAEEVEALLEGLLEELLEEDDEENGLGRDGKDIVGRYRFAKSEEEWFRR
jgi:hypothetical protein